MEEVFMTILLIDDQVDVCEIMSMIIEDELGRKVVSFQETKSAATFIQDHEEEISLIICDFKMPQENGVEFYEKVKNKGIPFILLTGMFFEKDDKKINDFMAGSKNRILYKPIDEKGLIKEINTIV
jgi:response regulator RpfG family c-di-GMP phosphodiesterase